MRIIAAPPVSGLVNSILVVSLYFAFKVCQRRTVTCDVIETVIDSYKRPEDGPHSSKGEELTQSNGISHNSSIPAI